MSFISYSHKVGKHGKITVGKTFDKKTNNKKPKNPKKIVIIIGILLLVTIIGSITEKKSNSNSETVTTTELLTTTTQITETTVKAVATTKEKSGITVYITPDGDKYHISKDCAGTNARAVDLDDAKDTREPCKKCSQ